MEGRIVRPGEGTRVLQSHHRWQRGLVAASTSDETRCSGLYRRANDHGVAFDGNDMGVGGGSAVSIAAARPDRDLAEASSGGRPTLRSQRSEGQGCSHSPSRMAGHTSSLVVYISPRSFLVHHPCDLSAMSFVSLTGFVFSSSSVLPPLWPHLPQHWGGNKQA
jgi:hypothetical protein